MPTDDSVSSAAALESRVWALMSDGDMRQSIAICRQLNTRFPEFAPGWHTASQLALKANDVPSALGAIEKALSMEPEVVPWLLQKAVCLAKLGRITQAEQLADRLSNEAMTTPYQCSAMGMLLTQLNRRSEAVGHYEKAAAMEPDEARHFYNVACLQRSLGEVEAAENNFDRVLALNPSDFEAYKIRSELREQTRDDNHIDELEQLLESGIEDPRGRVQVHFALAKELEDLGESERSFSMLKQGADMRRALMQYDCRRDIDTMRVIRKTFASGLFDGAKEGCSSTEAIFVLGLPRTGTTLVERILSSHENVFAAGELNNFAAQVMRQASSVAGSPKLERDEMVQLCADLDFRGLGRAYIDSTRPFTGHTAHFIDKMPLNYLYVGLIHLALPNARIINLQRDALDTCYAMYKQLFVDAYPFSYDLEELAHYYVAYQRLMEHWNSVMPGVIHTIDYEQLVTDPEGESRRLLRHCGLDWQPQCLKFYESKVASTTASTTQVRRPVYRSSIGKWKHYETQLQPVVSILKEAGLYE